LGTLRMHNLRPVLQIQLMPYNPRFSHTPCGIPDR
jgi:hypothetical protein